MKVVHTVAAARQHRWHEVGVSWGAVPTMGFLHEGHFSLVRRAQRENDRVAVSIFVNPTQFGDQTDLDLYPRNLDQDVAALEQLGVDLVFAPTVGEMYPAGFQTAVTLTELTNMLEGAARPGHFAGVATVVCKLLNILGPDRAYFGQKDAQQSVVVRQMVADLNLNPEIVICPTSREADGLARSSRNARLNEAERAAATVLYRALQAAASQIDAGARDGAQLRQTMAAVVTAEPLARLDYASVADMQTLQELDSAAGQLLLSLAVFVGNVRLIDNFVIELG